MADEPVEVVEVGNLVELGVQAGSLSLSTTTLEGENFVCVREKNAQGQMELVMIDLLGGLKASRRPMAADSVIMNPERQIIALKAGAILQIFDLESRSKLKSVQISENVVFWKWISSKTVGLVTETAVYHWSLDNQAEPVKVFDRHNSLASTQIINYRADIHEQWLALIGIAAGPNQTVSGQMQLYSVARKQSQVLEAHAASFATISLAGHETSLLAFVSKPVSGTAAKLHIIEVGTERKVENAPRFAKKSIDFVFPAGFESDFPVTLVASTKHAMIYVLTKMGVLHVYELTTGTCLCRRRVTETTVIVSCAEKATGGMLGLNRAGQLLSIRLLESKVIPYVMARSNDPSLGAKIAAQSGLPGADGYFMNRFLEFFNAGRYKEAAIVAAESPASALRNAETIARFKQVPEEEGQPPALLVYFQSLLERGKLNKLEAVELSQQVMALGRVQMVDKWLANDKLECSEQLGDLLKNAGELTMAMTVYVKAGEHNAVLRALIENGQIAKVVPYAQRTGVTVNIAELVQLASSHASPQAALELANALQASGLQTSSAESAAGARSMDDIAQMFDMFLQKGMLQEATAYVLDNMKEDMESSGELQTHVLVANLDGGAPQVADAILSRKVWSHFNKFKIAQACEKAGLIHHALLLYSDMSDIKRILTNTTHKLEREKILDFFATLSPEDAGTCLEILLRSNPRGNLTVCVEIATQSFDSFGSERLLALFGGLKIPEALFLLLQGILPQADDAEIHFRFIEESIKLGQFSEAERVTRESEHYSPEKVKNYLMSVKARDPRPLINVCDRFGYVDDLVKFMVKNGQTKFVEGYVTRVNPKRCPVVCGVLLDLDQDEEFVSNLVMQVKNTVSVEELTTEFEKRNKLKLLRPFFEAKVAEDSKDEAVHTGLGKVYVDANISPEHFLDTNEHYDPLAVGRYCAKRDPFLAVVAFRKGKCDDEMLELTNRNALFKEQAQYLVDREDMALWKRVLSSDNPNRKLIVDQITSSALPETQAPEKVSATVKAFMAADLPDLLIELLEKLVLHSSNAVFSKNRNLQNLLILTSIKTNKERAMEYIKKLENYDGGDIAQICIGADLYEEAFVIYTRFNRNEEAVGVLLDQMEAFDRAEEFANKLDEPAVWSRLGASQLKRRDMIAAGVTSLLKAKDPGPYEKVITACKDFEPGGETYDAVIKFLRFARTKVKDTVLVDTEIVIGLARCGRLAEAEEFISLPNNADLDEAGDRCLALELFPAAKLLFSATNDYGRLASVLVKLGDFPGAVESARKADRVPTWRIVCHACVEKKEFRLAQICALHLVVDANELQDVLEYYQDRGHFQEIVDVMDTSLSLERAHQAMFTETGILCTKYRPERVMDFCKMWWQRCAVPKLIRACEVAACWEEKVFLHLQYKEADPALATMVAHPLAWNHAMFLEAIVKCSNVESYYRAVSFYLVEHADLLPDLLTTVSAKADPARVTGLLKATRTVEYGEHGVLPLFKEYLQKVQQRGDVADVNEAYNEILLLENNVESLRQSIENFPAFDQLRMARKLEHATAIEYRRIAASLFRENKKYEQAVEVSKRDKLWRDAIESASASKDPELVDFLSRYFLDNELREGFTAMLLACYEFFRPALALEYSWTYGVMDFSMPFFVQTMEEIGNRVMGLEEESRERAQAVDEFKKGLQDEVNDDPSVLLHGVQDSAASAAFALTQSGGSGAAAQLALGWQK